MVCWCCAHQVGNSAQVSAEGLSLSSWGQKPTACHSFLVSSSETNTRRPAGLSAMLGAAREPGRETRFSPALAFCQLSCKFDVIGNGLVFGESGGPGGAGCSPPTSSGATGGGPQGPDACPSCACGGYVVAAVGRGGGGQGQRACAWRGPRAQ